MSNKVLLKFAKKGINLSPDAYNRIISSENPLSLTSSLIVKLKSGKYKSKDLISISGEVVDELLDNNNPQKRNTPEKNSEKEINQPESSTENKNEKNR